MALLTARAAAEKLGVGYSTLKRWVRSGRVRTTRTEGGHHRVAESEIDRLLARHQPAAQRRKARTENNESLGGVSARNRLFGYIEEVRADGLLAQVQLRVGDQRLTAVSTADAVRGSSRAAQGPRALRNRWYDCRTRYLNVGQRSRRRPISTSR